MVISVVFDLIEKIDDLIDNRAPLYEIIFHYYANFIPYFAILFTPLFLFISVVFFTSRMAAQSEITAILTAGITFPRMLRPYMIAASVVVGLNLWGNHWFVPQANKTRIRFERTYINNPFQTSDMNIHLRVNDNEYAYVQNYTNSDSVGDRFAYEIFEGGILKYKMTALRIQWDGKINAWHVINYVARENNKLEEHLHRGTDSVIHINLSPKDFDKKIMEVAAMNSTELFHFIESEKKKGATGIAFYEVERDRRTSFPFAIFVLTLIAVSMSSRKARGGIGMHVGLSITIAFAYILFMQFSTTFSTNSGLPSLLGVWIPNIIFSFIALVVYRYAPK